MTKINLTQVGADRAHLISYSDSLTEMCFFENLFWTRVIRYSPLTITCFTSCYHNYNRNPILLDIMILDGMTILRFTHATSRSGGIEQYLNDLNRILLERNRMSIIQLYLPEGGAELPAITEDSLGMGTLITVPMKAQCFDDVICTRLSNKACLSTCLSFLRGLIRDFIVYSPLLPKGLRRLVTRRGYSRYNREPIDARERLCDVANNRHIDMIILHLAGGVGGLEVIQEAQKRRIPYLICNHFSNSWFRRIGFREQIIGASGIAGVSSREVPMFLRDRFTNVSDGIDTNAYRRSNARPVPLGKQTPIVLLPSRMTPGKGHRDLLIAVNRLRKEGIQIRVAFAGRCDLPEFKHRLEADIIRMGLSENVVFTGECDLQNMVDLYAASSVVALPTYSEGLGRVILEAQSMEVPPIAYDVGGVSEALIDGKTGYLVKRGDLKGLRFRIRELITAPERRIKMGQMGRAFIEERFSQSFLANRHEHWYLHSINRSQAG